MQALDVRTRPLPPKGSIYAELTDLGGYVQRTWPALRPPIVLEWTEVPVVAIDDSCGPWLYGPIEQDLVHGSHGVTVVPRRRLTQLKEIAALGVPFQRLAIAHELDVEGPVRQLLPELGAGPRACTDELAQALIGGVPEHPGVVRAVRALDGWLAVRRRQLPQGS
jgi:hypothetical protein